MKLQDLKEQITAVLGDRSVPRERRRLLYEYGDLLAALEATASDEAAARGTRTKASAVLEFLLDCSESHPEQGFLEAYLLNFVGEALVRHRYASKEILHFLKIGLYFYGLNYIERHQASRAMEWMIAHADELEEFTKRDAMKAMIKDGAEKIEEEKPFCVVHVYLNAVRRRFWAGLRSSEDAADHSLSLISEGEREWKSGEVRPAAGVETFEQIDPKIENRVILMLSLFADQLDERQRRIYLARHPLTGRFAESARNGIPNDLDDLFRELEGDGKSTWTDLASRFDCTEKTVKREYMRSLLGLLEGAVQSVFPDRVPSSFVRRMIATLREISQERDLRIKDHAGRGLGKIVERWEIALRYVLNHSMARELQTASSQGEQSKR